MKRIVRILLNLIGLEFKSNYDNIVDNTIVIVKELERKNKIISNIKQSKIVSELSIKDYTAIFNPSLDNTINDKPDTGKQV